MEQAPVFEAVPVHDLTDGLQMADNDVQVAVRFQGVSRRITTRQMLLLI